MAASDPPLQERLDRKKKAQVALGAVSMLLIVSVWFLASDGDDEPAPAAPAADASAESTPTAQPEPTPTEVFPEVEPSDVALERKLNRYLRRNFGMPGFRTSWYADIKYVVATEDGQVFVTTALTKEGRDDVHVCAAVLGSGIRSLEVTVTDIQRNVLHRCP